MADTTELVPELLEAGVHFGHQTKRWNPKMKPFIFEQRNQIYIINLDETVRQLRRATDFLQEVARRGGRILFVGCKKQAQEAIKEAALACGQFYVNQRWLGGTLTNLTTIRKSIGRLKYIEQIEQSPEYKKMGKQELAALNREAAKLRRNLEGILEMSATARCARGDRHATRGKRRQGGASPRNPGGRHRGYQRRSRTHRLSDCGER